jgi:hypothetical protein
MLTSATSLLFNVGIDNIQRGANMRKVERLTVDLSTYPDLVVIYLGMRVNSWAGLRTLYRIGREIREAVDDKPNGLLLHETIMYRLVPPHIGMRQYWRDFEALEAWSRSGLHRDWWQEFLAGGSGVGFWHEAYFRRGGMEAVYDDMPAVGFGQFAPRVPARGPLFSARARGGQSGTSAVPAPVAEHQLDR